MRLLAALLLSAIIAYAIGWRLSIHANPEVIFWQEVVERRDSELASIRASRPDEALILFTGGSSCAFSIDPAIIEAKTGRPAMNLGLPVYAGAAYLIHQAISRTRSGDVLVLALELELFVDPDSKNSPTPLSLALAAHGGRVNEAAGGETFHRQMTLRAYLNQGRPGLRYLTTSAGRWVTGRNYRYGVQDIRDGGRVETAFLVEDLRPTLVKAFDGTPQDGRQLLQEARAAAEGQGVELIFTLPWYLVDEDQVERARGHRAALLEEISEFLPVVDDGYLGCATERSWFSDTALHLSAEGSAIRSEALGRALAAWLEQEEAED